MENLNLTAEIRDKKEKSKILRKLKMLPAVVYWKKQESIPLKLDYSSFLKTFRKSWESHIINLHVDKKDIEVLVHSVQREPITWDFTHVDFFALIRWEAVTTKIHLEFIWDSPASREGAIIEEHMKDIEVRCLPTDLRDNFEVDLSLLKEIWDNIKVGELDIDPEKYELTAPKDEIVVSASIPKKVEIEEEVPPEDQGEQPQDWAEWSEETEDKDEKETEDKNK